MTFLQCSKVLNMMISIIISFSLLSLKSLRGNLMSNIRLHNCLLHTGISKDFIPFPITIKVIKNFDLDFINEIFFI